MIYIIAIIAVVFIVFLSMKDKKEEQPKHVYNLVKDTVDPRDYEYKSFRPAQDVKNFVDLSSAMSPVVDQGNLGSCTSNAIVSGLYEYLRIKCGLKSEEYPAFSRLYHYYKEREKEGTIGEDSGAQIRTGMKMLQQTGVCTENLWPYIIRKFTKKPTAEADNNAKLYVIDSYSRISSIEEMKQSLSNGYPVVAGIKVYASFESDTVAKTGIVPTPQNDEKCLGGHAVLIVGYDNANRTIKFRNSWGSNWGDKGYFTMSYDTFNILVMDMWTGIL